MEINKRLISGVIIAFIVIGTIIGIAYFKIIKVHNLDDAFDALDEQYGGYIDEYIYGYYDSNCDFRIPCDEGGPEFKEIKTIGGLTKGWNITYCSMCVPNNSFDHYHSFTILWDGTVIKHDPVYRYDCAGIKSPDTLPFASFTVNIPENIDGIHNITDYALEKRFGGNKTNYTIHGYFSNPAVPFEHTFVRVDPLRKETIVVDENGMFGSPTNWNFTPSFSILIIGNRLYFLTSDGYNEFMNKYACKHENEHAVITAFDAYLRLYGMWGNIAYDHVLADNIEDRKLLRYSAESSVFCDFKKFDLESERIRYEKNIKSEFCSVIPQELSKSDSGWILNTYTGSAQTPVVEIYYRKVDPKGEERLFQRSQLGGGIQIIIISHYQLKITDKGEIYLQNIKRNARYSSY